MITVIRSPRRRPACLMEIIATMIAFLSRCSKWHEHARAPADTCWPVLHGY